MDVGMSNLEMEFIIYMINTCKMYYSNFLYSILVYEMPWFMNGKQKLLWKLRKSFDFPINFPATFQIIKKLLPKQAVDRLKFISKKNVRQFIDEENMPHEWGGKDDYVFTFEPEVRQNDEMKHENGKLLHPGNNNTAEHKDLNLLHKKVMTYEDVGNWKLWNAKQISGAVIVISTIKCRLKVRKFF